jgi:hypothetical protein
MVCRFVASCAGKQEFFYGSSEQFEVSFSLYDSTGLSTDIDTFEDNKQTNEIMIQALKYFRANLINELFKFKIDE